MKGRRLRIGIDARLASYRRGIGNYIYNLIRALSKLPVEHDYVVYVDHTRALEFLNGNANFEVRVLGQQPYPFWEQVSLPLAASRDNLEILHCPANSGPLVLSKRVKLVVTIHDVMYLLPRRRLPASPSAYQRVGRTYLRLIVPIVARRASGISTVSEHSRQDIVALIGLPTSRISIVAEAAGDVFRSIDDDDAASIVRTKHGLDAPFLFALGAVDPRKNTARVIEAYARFRKARKGLGERHLLVVAGLTAAGRNRFMQLADELDVADEIVLMGFISEEDLVALYNAAVLFAYPSLYEGFGLPVLEAMACGTPVVTSGAGSLREVAGDAAVMIDPLSVEELAQAFLRVVTDPSLRQDLREKGKAQAQRFSWGMAATGMTKVYRAAYAGGQRR